MTNVNIKLPILDIEDYDIPHERAGQVSNEIQGSVQYAFIGSGQGGCRLAREFYHLGYRKTLCLNTAPQDLLLVDLPDTQKLLLDIGQGGAGKNMERGEKAAVAHRQEIYDLMRRVFGKVDHIIICASAGGGSGGGSVFALIMVAKRYLRYIGYDDVDQRVGVMVTLPTRGEASSPKVAVNAYDLVQRLSDLAEAKQVTPLIIIDNDKIKQLYSGLPVATFWPTLNKNVAQLFDAFNRLSTQNSPYTTFDPEDYRTIITGGGHCIFGLTTVKGMDTETVEETRISNALKANLEKTLLAGGFDITTATHAACCVVGGEQMFAQQAGLQDAIEYAFDTLTQMTGEAMVHRGIYQSERELLLAYTILSGLKRPDERYLELSRQAQRAYP